MQMRGQCVELNVRLMKEDIDVVRPSYAKLPADGNFEELPPPYYDPENDTWEFHHR